MGALMPLHGLAQDAVLEILPYVPSDKVGEWLIKFFPEISRLDELSRRGKRRKDAQDVIDSLDFPLKVGEACLYRLTVGGMEWLENYPQKWWGGNNSSSELRLVELATCYAMANRGKESYERLTTPKDAKREIIAWVKSTKAAEDALFLAANCLLPENDPIAREIMGVPDEDGKGVNIQAVAMKVAALAGVSVVSAIWEMSADSFWNIYCDWIDEQEDELNASLKAAKKAPHVETWIVRQKIALIKARRELLSKTLEWLKGMDAEQSGKV